MTYQDIKDFTTQLLNGETLGTSDFDRLLHSAQRKYERKREWMMLKGINSSLTLTRADTYLTAKALPADFGRFNIERPVVLKDSAGNERVVRQIPMEARQAYFNIFGFFYVDYYNSNVYFTGTADQTYTIIFNYQIAPSDIDASHPWFFPADFHYILPYDIAVNYKTGIDYDITNAQQANNNQQQINEIWQNMVAWDAGMQADALKGLDRRVDDQYIFTSGTVNTID